MQSELSPWAAGLGGLVNSFLSWEFWIPLARLRNSDKLTNCTGVYIVQFDHSPPPPPSFEIIFFPPTNKFAGGGVGRPPSENF